MTRDDLRFLAQHRYPVVQNETGTHGEIVYPFIREIKVVYASVDESRRGFPMERIAVSVADRSGHSYTECLMRDLRLPTDDEARVYALPSINTEQMINDLRRIRK